MEDKSEITPEALQAGIEVSKVAFINVLSVESNPTFSTAASGLFPS